jgi:hypothetical protein
MRYYWVLGKGSSFVLSVKWEISMAVNLLDSVKEALAGQVADQLGSAVGLDKQQTASALKTVVPMLLGGMMKKASTPSGASDLSKALRDTDTSILDNLGGLLGNSSSSSNLISMGTKLLPMLFGSSQSSIISILVKLLGFNEKSIGSLLSLLIPIVMAVVGKQAKSAGGFDVGALTNLLGGQKNFIANAVPSELKGALGLAGDLGASASRKVEPAASSNPLQWLLPLLAVAALGFLAYNFLFNQKPADKNPPVKNDVVIPKGGKGVVPAEPAVVGIPPIPELPDLTDIKDKLKSTFEGLTGTLEGIKDEEGAKSALSKIEDASKAYEGLGVGKLPTAAQAVLGPFLKPYITKVKELVEGLYKIPGVKQVIDPVLGPMLQTVEGIGA